MFKIVHAPNEWVTDFNFTEKYLTRLEGDIFTWWQRYPDVSPHYQYPMIWDNMAVCEFNSYDDWWRKIGKKTRNMVRKAKKNRVKVKIVAPDVNFFQGVMCIYNETPIRQGKYFKHYGKPLEYVIEKFKPWLDERNVYIGAYWKNELIGFVHLIKTDKYWLMSQILSYIKHRDKAPNNILISEAVWHCSQTSVKRIVYGRMSTGGLGKFKINNGFERKLVPRYYVPLSGKGKIFINLRLYKLQNTLRTNLPEYLKPIFRPAWRKVSTTLNLS